MTEAGRAVEVAVALPLAQTLTYLVPPALAGEAVAGSLVKVPVGRRAVTGYLLGPGEAPPPGVALKEVQAVLDPVPRFGPDLVPLLRWLADYYQYPLGEALKHVIPGGARPSGGRRETWAVPLPEAEAPPLPKRLGPKARALLEHLRESGPLAISELALTFPRCRPVLRRLAALGLISLEEHRRWRDPLAGRPLALEEPAPTLVPEQREALKAIVAGIHSRAFAPFLLHGVTASGKTEVYLAAAAQTLAQGRQVLVLAPEIALTHPVALAFRSRFGGGVTVLHSGLSPGARLDQWRRIVAEEVDVVVGARSAVFAPLPRLGLVVVDEEHDPAYKQEGGLLYQARDVALYRGREAGAAVVLVSATPQVTTYWQAQQGKYRYLNLCRRVTPQDLPEVSLVNLKEHRQKGLTVISRPLAAALGRVLERGEQALLFLNRRGYSRVLFCLLCGQVFQCVQCSVALTHHQGAGELVCHYCGYREAVPERCSHCQSTAIKRYGVGTEKVEAEVHRLFPQARVARLDRDTAPTSGRALKTLESFAGGGLDILVGTQMITKGHHFPRVTLVGVIAADLGLFFPEYHASERTFQLLSQVAGRAGRGEAMGRVLIQTYHPEHFVFQAVRDQDYPGFFARELEGRKKLGYPPFTRLALVRLSGPEEDAVSRAALRLTEALKEVVRQDHNLQDRVRILGPAPPLLARLKGRYRWQLLVKSYGRQPLARVLEQVRRTWTPPPRSRIDLTVDMDPASLA